MSYQGRVKALNSKEIIKGDFVVYWMQHSQRTHCNHALEFSIDLANRLEKPLVVYFGAADFFPEANSRHYRFMFEGLKEVEAELEKRGIKFAAEKKDPEKGIVGFSKKASAVVTDRGYLKILKKWREYAAQNLSCILYQVESDLVVPVEEASLKEDYAAYTIRKKITSKIDDFLVLPEKEKILKEFSCDLPEIEKLDFTDIPKLLKKFSFEQNLSKADFKGGTSKALKLLDTFVNEKLPDYDEKRNNPCLDFTSNLSPYLHFGQISPLYIAYYVRQFPGNGTDSFLEELIVRRELAFNFVNYNNLYDSFDCLPDWAKNSLTLHKNDKRAYIYSIEEFENSDTHDRYWNAAQLEMVKTGKMHGYMRMYWGKKILEWSSSPEKAFQTALYLNNKYALDGRDPNSFAGVAWCFGKHDRAWKEREIFGKVRYMNAKGLKRKFNADLYADNVYSLT
ncbi:MAG: deoxyribodipyrimidine photo-lyase [Thermodesulfobacteriota bacterium]